MGVVAERTKVSLDQSEDFMRERFKASLMWEIKGPRATQIERIQCWNCGGKLALVEVYKGGGWDIFAQVQAVETEKTESDMRALWGAS